MSVTQAQVKTALDRINQLGSVVTALVPGQTDDVVFRLLMEVFDTDRAAEMIAYLLSLGNKQERAGVIAAMLAGGESARNG